MKLCIRRKIRITENGSQCLPIFVNLLNKTHHCVGKPVLHKFWWMNAFGTAFLTNKNHKVKLIFFLFHTLIRYLHTMLPSRQMQGFKINTKHE